MLGRAWEWVKGHSGLLLAGGVGLVAVWYLFLRGGTSGAASAGPTTVDLTGAGDQAGGGGATPTPSNVSVPNLPYPNIDFGPIGAIADAALRALYESAANVEEQINQATRAGQTDLANTLQARLSNIQQQIADYQGPSTAAPPLAQFTQDILGSGPWTTLGGLPGGTSATAASRTQLLAGLFPDLSADQARQLSDVFHVYGGGGGSQNLTPAQATATFNRWLTAVRAGQGQALVDSLRKQFAYYQ